MLYLAVSSILLIMTFLEVFRFKNLFKPVFFFLALLTFILISTFRWKVGGDTHSYQMVYEDFIPRFNEIEGWEFLVIGWEPLFLVVMIACKSISSKFWIFQALHAIFINFIIFNFFRRNSKFYLSCVFLYSFFFYLYFNTEILREAICVCIFIASYPLIEKKRTRLFYAIALFSSLFHYSALITLLIPHLIKIQANSKNLLIAFVFVCSIIPTLNIVESGLNSLGLEILAKKVSLYSQIKLNYKGMIIVFIVFFILPYFIYLSNLKNRFAIKFCELAFSYFLFVFIYLIFSGFGRFLNYLMPFMVVYFVSFIEHFFSVWKYSIKWKLYTLILLIMIPILFKGQYYMQSTTDIVPNTRVFNRWYPYSSIFNKSAYWEPREVLYSEGMKASIDSQIKE